MYISNGVPYLLFNLPTLAITITILKKKLWDTLYMNELKLEEP